MLRVLNRELGADFDHERFEHVARYDPDNEWIEMRLRSTEAQVVNVPALDLVVPFAEGEEMRTEVSSKFRRERVARAGRRRACAWSSGGPIRPATSHCRCRSPTDERGNRPDNTRARSVQRREAASNASTSSIVVWRTTPARTTPPCARRPSASISSHA